MHNSINSLCFLMMITKATPKQILQQAAVTQTVAPTTLVIASCGNKERKNIRKKVRHKSSVCA